MITREKRKEIENKLQEARQLREWASYLFREVEEYLLDTCDNELLENYQLPECFSDYVHYGMKWDRVRLWLLSLTKK